jgi:hypothetical protein
VVSLLLIAVVTVSRKVMSAWKYRDSLQRIHHPKLFIITYACLFALTKIIAVHILILAMTAETNRCSTSAQAAPMYLLVTHGPSLLLLMYFSNETAKFIDGGVKTARRLANEGSESGLLNRSEAALANHHDQPDRYDVGVSSSPDGVKAISVLCLLGQISGIVNLFVVRGAFKQADGHTAITSICLLSLSILTCLLALIAV